MSQQQVDTQAIQASYGVMARYYDTIYADTAPKDTPFYLELAHSLPGPVLELGCGTGRVALALARAGLQVVGLDLSEAMLQVFRSKLALEPAEVRERVELVHGSMADFNLGRKFGLILVPFRAFQHLMTVEDQRACLLSVAQHLLPAGRFVHNLFDPRLESIVQSTQTGPRWILDHECVDQASGRVLRRYYMQIPEPAAKTLRLWFKHEEYDSSGLLLSTTVDKADMRWQYRLEAQYLLELCGLEVAAAYGGFDKSALDERFREQIYVCRLREPQV
jgi:SAM-dependent methyltransferase